MINFSHLMGQKVAFLYKNAVGYNFIIVGDLVGFSYFLEDDSFSLLIRDSKGHEDFFENYEHLQEFDDNVMLSEDFKGTLVA